MRRNVVLSFICRQDGAQAESLPQIVCPDLFAIHLIICFFKQLPQDLTNVDCGTGLFCWKNSMDSKFVGLFSVYIYYVQYIQGM